jgi:hypothetical protein
VGPVQTLSNIVHIHDRDYLARDGYHPYFIECLSTAPFFEEARWLTIIPTYEL